MAEIILIDNYGVEYARNFDPLHSDSHIKVAQSFTGKSANLTNCKFYLKRYGNPIGEIVCKLYAHSGTYGISSIPTDELLATSNPIDIETIPSIYFHLITFDFTVPYTLIEGTKYCISLEYDEGNNNNYLLFVHNKLSPTHLGNKSWTYDGIIWSPVSNTDCIFYVYGEGVEPISEADLVLSIAKPITLKTTKEINGAWTANMRICPDNYIGTENYVDIDDEQYIVKNLKKIKSGGEYYYDVGLYHNAMEELIATSIDRFSLLKSPTYLLDYILADTIWTAGECDIDEIISLITNRRVTGLEALNLLADKCGGELYFHSKDRIVDLKRQIGSDTKLQLRYDKNCDYIEKEEDSSELVTRIYPYGPDNWTINTTILDDCEDETLYIPSGAGSTEKSDFKQSGSQGIKIISSTLNETFIRDLGAGNVKDLSGHDLLKFWIYSEEDNANGFIFGISEDNVMYFFWVNTGALTAGCWKEIEVDLSKKPDDFKDAIRYIKFINLTNGAAECVFDSIRAFNGEVYIDSPNRTKYKVNKEYTYFHSARVEKTQSELILYPNHDSYARQDTPNTNYGSNNPWAFRASGIARRTPYMKFDFSSIPADAVINSAILNQYKYDRCAGGDALFYCVTEDWNENTLTWNNKPAFDSGTSYGTYDIGTNSAVGWIICDLTTLIQAWINNSFANYGLCAYHSRTTDTDTGSCYTKEASNKPYLKIVYTIETNPEPIIKAAAQAYLEDHDEPKLKYKVKMADLSKVMVDTWEDEEVNLGDTARIYDSELDLNIDVRIKKITKDILDPRNVDLELVNKAYSIADLEAKRAIQLDYAMPFKDNPKIISANAIQEGYLGI